MHVEIPLVACHQVLATAVHTGRQRDEVGATSDEKGERWEHTGIKLCVLRHHHYFCYFCTAIPRVCNAGSARY